MKYYFEFQIIYNINLFFVLFIIIENIVYKKIVKI